jgi:hypothetical protein
MDPTNSEPTLEEVLADPIIQLVMSCDNINADDVRRIIHEACRRRDVVVERSIGAPPDHSPSGFMLRATIVLLFVPVTSNAVQEDLYDGGDCLLHLFFGWRRSQSENDLQMKVVTDHADKVPGHAQAIIRPNLPSFPGDFKNLGEPDGGPAWSLFVKRLRQIREPIGLGDGNSVDAYQGGRHVDVHQMPTERDQRRPQVEAFEFLDGPMRQHLVCIFLDDRGEQALLVAELIVDVAFRPAGAIDDRVDACRSVALFEKDAGSRFKKGFSAALRLFCPCCNHDPLPITMHPLTGNVRYHMCQW